MRADDNDRRVPLSAIARRYQHFLLDLDGCLFVGDEPTERAAAAVAALREASKGIVFLTNEVASSPEEIVRKLWRLGFQASLAEVMTAGAALQYMLAARPAAAPPTSSARGRWSTTSPRRGCGSSTTPSSPPAPTSSWSPTTSTSTTASCAPPPRRCCAAPS